MKTPFNCIMVLNDILSKFPVASDIDAFYSEAHVFNIMLNLMFVNFNALTPVILVLVVYTSMDHNPDQLLSCNI